DYSYCCYWRSDSEEADSGAEEHAELPEELFFGRDVLKDFLSRGIVMKEMKIELGRRIENAQSTGNGGQPPYNSHGADIVAAAILGLIVVMGIALAIIGSFVK